MWQRFRFKGGLGKAFSDNVILSRKRVNLAPKHLTGWGARITLLYVCLLGCFFLLAVRLFHLTIAKGHENRSLSEDNRIRSIRIHAPRGIFYDRLGIPLVKDLPVYRVTGPCKPHQECHTQLLTIEEVQTEGISKESIFLEKDYLRQYAYPYEMAHVVGYMGEISAVEIANPLYTYQDYIAGDRLGRSGLEAITEKQVRGIDGRELIEVDAEHNKMRTLGKIDPVPGNDMTLSLDAEIQKTAFEALGENTGAVIVSKPKTGEIIALVSAPSFNPNKFHKGLTAREYETLLTNPYKPLINRAVSEVYPPGSTFKLVVATAALESGKITKSTYFEDTGILKVGNFSFGNWYFLQYGGIDGAVDMVKAIARSNDIYFYKTGETVGVSTIAEWGEKMGIGHKTGITLNGEAEGIMPDPAWRKKVRNEEWYLGDTYHLAIGQGELAVTPLHVNLWTNIIANGGVMCAPTLFKAQSSELKTQNCKDLEIKKETTDLIWEGMRRACSSGKDVGYQGTGWPLFDFTVLKETLSESGGVGAKYAIPIACKTGTAEFGDPDNKTHAWFTAFAPIPNQPKEINGVPTITGEPEITVTVLVEKGGEGSSVAAPIARKIFEEWFKR